MGNKERDSFNPEPLIRLGLFRDGDHTDEHIQAIAPDGQAVDLDVVPVKIGSGTLFFPKRGQDKALRQLHPRRPWNI